MAGGLPKDYDAIIVGTGLTESIIAAGLSRNGYTTLHIDRHDFYGADWASLSFSRLTQLLTEVRDSAPAKECAAGKEVVEADENAGTRKLIVPTRNTISNVVIDVFIPTTTQTHSSSAPPKCHSPVTGLVGTDDAVLSCVKDSPVECDGNQPVDSPSGCTQGLSQLDENRKTSKNTTGDDPTYRPAASSIGNTGQCSEESSSEMGTSTAPPTVGEVASRAEIPPVLPQWTVDDLMKSRRFNLDLTPKVVYKKSVSVDLLRSSDVAKYAEFHSITRVLTGGYDVGVETKKLSSSTQSPVTSDSSPSCSDFPRTLEQVPCGQQDIFKSKKIPLIEKNALSKLLKLCMKSEESQAGELEDFSEQLFSDFLNSGKLSNRHLSLRTKHFLMHSVAMAEEDRTTTKEAMRSMKRFVESSGLFQKQPPFLWPLYGGELTQCFCRFSAVFGGIYCLPKKVEALVVKDNRLTEVHLTDEDSPFTCRWFVTSAGLAPLSWQPKPSTSISRAILITDRSFQPSGSDEITVATLKGRDNSLCTVLELPPSTGACPKGLYVVHLTKRSEGEACEDLAPFVSELYGNVQVSGWAAGQSSQLNESSANILWAGYFNLASSFPTDTESRSSGDAIGDHLDTVPENVVVIPGPGAELDTDPAFNQAQAIFSRLCPDVKEFLPKPPAQEDIVYGEEGETKDGVVEPEHVTEMERKDGVVEPEHVTEMERKDGVVELKHVADAEMERKE